jgi:hypothetical protein
MGCWRGRQPSSDLRAILPLAPDLPARPGAEHTPGSNSQKAGHLPPTGSGPEGVVAPLAQQEPSHF